MFTLIFCDTIQPYKFPAPDARAVPIRELRGRGGGADRQPRRTVLVRDRARRAVRRDPRHVRSRARLLIYF